MKLALVVLAALWTTPGAAHAQDGFGHFGNFSSTQGAASQWSATAPGMYASGEYAYVGPYAPWGKLTPSYSYAARIVRYQPRTIYVPSTPSNVYEVLPFPYDSTYRSSNPYSPVVDQKSVTPARVAPYQGYSYGPR
jgi:hypothetical protein